MKMLDISSTETLRFTSVFKTTLSPAFTLKMENIRFLFQLYFRPASAMSDIIDTGNWLFASVLVLLVSLAFFAFVNVKLNDAYRIPQFGQFYDPEYSQVDEDSPLAQAQYNKAVQE